MTDSSLQSASQGGKVALVTGGAGFIGTNLCARLLDMGWRVLCLDNLSSGTRENVSGLLGREGFSFIEDDITRPGVFDGLEPVSWVFNLACPASPPFYQADPIGTMKTNVVGALAALEFAQACGARILQTSTSEVYGDPLEHPQREEYRGNVNTTGPRACYDEGKRAAEALFFDFERTYGTDIRVVRIFNTYGPHMRIDDGRVTSNFIWQALHGDDITVYGEGSQTRSFCFVDDLVDGLIAMMEQEGFSGPVNLGNPEEFTIMEFARKVIEFTGTASRITCEGLPVDDPQRRKPDISLAKDKLGWEPRIKLDEGLRRTIDYFQGLR